MKELIQQKFWVHTRGVEMLLSPSFPQYIENEGEYKLSDEESERLRQIINDGTLKRRYPTPNDGREFMSDIDFDRRDHLLGMAYEASNKIVEEWRRINPDKDVAVILFGSVAKGLVKNPDHKDPSNIDMAVIGDITDDESEKLFDAIRPYRTSIQEKILIDCVEVESEDINPGNLGVLIQHTDKLTNGHYSGAAAHIMAGAFPLHDPQNIWTGIEHYALKKMSEEQNHKRQRRQALVIPEWRNFEPRIRYTENRKIEKPKLKTQGVIFEQLPLSNF